MGREVRLHRVAAFCLPRLRLFELARVLVRLNHVASFIVNANHSASEIRLMRQNALTETAQLSQDDGPFEIV